MFRRRECGEGERESTQLYPEFGYLPLFSPAMKLLEDIAQVLVGDVGVDLCGADVAVAQHALDAAQVGTVH